MFTPARRRGVEILDDPGVDPEIRNRSIDDVTRSNTILGGLRAALTALKPLLHDGATLLDVGTGLADIPNAARRLARIHTTGVDEAPSLLASAGARLDFRVCANALALPFRDHSVDVVMCSQVLHHFEDHDAEALIREMHRVARKAVVISDLRRSWIAAGGFWLVSFPLGFHSVTRHDGVVSVLRGFTADDLRRLVHNAVGVEPAIRHHLGFRLTGVIPIWA